MEKSAGKWKKAPAEMCVRYIVLYWYVLCVRLLYCIGMYCVSDYCIVLVCIVCQIYCIVLVCIVCQIYCIGCEH